MKVGYIGVGIMGAPMAGHIQRAGHDLFLVKNRSELPEALLTDGATACATPADVAAAADVIFLNVPDTPDVEKVLFGDGGVAEKIGAGKIIVDNSTICPDQTRIFAARIEALGSDFIDAPVSGGDIGAQKGELSVMIGAKPEALDRVRPLIETFAKTMTHVGPVGTGQTCKACNQIIVALTIEAVAEALVFAAKAGADPVQVRKALLGGFAGSRILEIHGQRMIDANYDPGFRINLHQKDLAIALNAAQNMGMPLPNTATTQSLLNACQADGGDARDSAAIVTVFEELALARVKEAADAAAPSRS
ncbi:MAG: 2-hydroxy-3-oxopropionate reductase [Parvularcula sp.]